MIRRFFNLKSGTAKTPARVPKGLRVYAIGDIHGCSDLLEAMHAMIRADIEASPPHQATVVYLGDYIDRGPDSKGVLDLLIQPLLGGVDRVLLKGNHEAELELFLSGGAARSRWRQFGGLETILSYGVDVNAALSSGEGEGAIARELALKIPAEHRDLIASAKPRVSIGDYFFCHAGARPGVPLDQQSLDDLLWIRDEFLSSNFNFGKVVVHGHTPVMEPEFRPNRINIDTGAYASDRLTCLVLEGAERRVLATGRAH